MMNPVRLHNYLLTYAIVLAVCCAADSAHAQVYVRGYTKSNGTYVAPHYRSSPDGNFSNNWSTKGNFNPYTGKEGTRVTPPTGYGGSYPRGSYSLGSYTDNTSASRSYLGGYVSEDDSSGWSDNPFYSGKIPALLTPAEPHDEQLQDIAAMNFHGIGFSTTHQQFLRLFPQARMAAPVDSAGVISYAIEDVDGKRDAIWLQFLNDQFLRLGFTYGEARVRQYGGTNVLLDRAKQRFGPPTREDGTTTLWLFPTIDRLIMAGMDGKSWYLVVTRLSAQKTVNAKREKVDVGF
jgi:hypothetical protein